MEFEDFCGSVFWDLSISWNTTNPDFTPCFQKTVLIWIPCAFLWLFLPLEIYLINKSSRIKYPWTGLNITKTIFGVLLMVLSLFNMIHWLVYYYSTTVDIPYANINSPLISSITYLLAIILINVERRQGMGSSGVIFIFWLLQALATTVIFRSHLISALDSVKIISLADYIICVVSYPLIIGELVLSAFFDSSPPTTKSELREKNPCPEPNSSLLTRLVFAWFDKMAYLGFKKPLKERDLWDLADNNRSDNIVPLFQNSWQAELKKYREQEEIPGKTKQMPSILSALWKSFRWSFIIAGFMRLISDMLAFVTPLMLQMMIDYVASDEPEWRGYLYAVVLFLASLCQSIIYGQQYLMMFNMALRVRASLISSIYQKALKINSAVKRTSTVGEIVNLMSVDVQRLMDLLPEIHLIWTALIQIVVALYLLWNLLGPSVLAGLGVMILMVPVNGLIASRFRALQFKQMKFKDQRVKLMNEVLNGIKVLKLYAWEESFNKQISDIRNEELKVMKTGAYLNAAASFVFNTVPLMVTLATFATYVLIDDKNILDASKAFVSLSLFNIIRMPLFLIPMLFISAIQAMVSFKRMNKFLTSEELDTDVISHKDIGGVPIFVENGNFTWGNKDDAATLIDITLGIPKGNLVAIVGPVGSGKSSLASAILGDMEKISGTVNTVGSFAYVAQQAWIQNATLKENILFGKPLDEEHYNRVIEACALKPDLDILPGGDSTEIGEKGINLSGGQKHRVSLARAVYSDADNIVLDDPLSAVDSHVGKHIFEEVIGEKGLLKDKTRFFVTNNITYLPRMDRIFVLKDGKITEQGSYDDLLEQKGDFAEFLMSYLQEQDNQELSEEELTDLEGIAKDLITRIGSPEIQRQLSRRISVKSPVTDGDTDGEGRPSMRMSRRSSSVRRHSEGASKRASPIPQKYTEKMDDGTKLIQIETTETGKVRWAVYVDYLRAVGFFTVLLTFMTYVFSAGFGVGSNIWLSIWSQDPPSVNNTQDIGLRDLRLGVYGGLGFGQAIAVFLGSFIMALGAINASQHLHQAMLTNILKCSMGFFDTTPLGRIVNRFSKDVDTVDTTIPMILRALIMIGLSVISSLAVISMSTPIFMSIILPIGILFYIIQRIYISTSRQLKRLESITRSPIFSHFSETISGASTIRAYNKGQEFVRESETRVDKNHICYYPSIVASRWLSVRLEFLSSIIIFCAALFAVLSRKTLDAGTIGLSISYAAQITNILTFLVRLSSDLETNIVAVERIDEYAQAPTEAAWEIKKYDPAPSWPEQGVIIFQHYSTRYRPGLDLILKDITCHISSGEKIGIVGRTGAGKSSLTLGLFRIIEASEGEILIDGIDTSIIGLHALRSKLTVIPQDPVLFSGTLRMNIDPFEKYTDNELWKALDLSHLKTFVTTLPLRLDHHIAEGGENISVGQRQLLCLARALLRKTKVLVLDEATAAVDLETDDLIQATIRKEFADCTVLTIAHRLNTIMDSTRIIMLDKGQICEFDSPTNLLQNKKSMFYGMAKDAGLV